MSHLSFFIAILFSCSLFSQKKWDGGGGNNLWVNALNWTGNAVPGVNDDVLLDNSIVTSSYAVVLPNTAVTVRTLTINPASSRSIDATLPVTNTLLPGFTATGPSYGMVINSGGTFRNSSGSTSGNAVVVTDSIRVNNNGRYVHNTASGHASNVLVLSRAAGTESGIFELDIPAASSTISMSGRTFGKFVLRSTAAGGSCNYTAAGSARVTIRNHFDIGAGVNLSLNCTDTIAVAGDLLQEAGTLNLGSSIRSVVLSVQQNITQNTGGVITETGSGTQTLLLAGSGLQVVILKGTVQNSVSVAKNGLSVAFFKWPVSLPYKLSLKKGRMVTSEGLITLQSACTIDADTLSASTFIDGPVKKDGLNNQSFLFPVGKSGVQRWIALQNATGNFTVEYFNTDPHMSSSKQGTGLHHVSSVEYWEVNGATGATAKLKLSFVDPGSGGVTNLTSLRVARLINGTWEDAGNTAVSGTPGSDGWVSSNAASGFSANTKLFALASATGLENPLPLSSIHLKMIRNVNSLFFSWENQQDLQIGCYEFQMSTDNKNYSTFKRINQDECLSKCSITVPEPNMKMFYRVRSVHKLTNENNYSEVVPYFLKNQQPLISGNTLAYDQLKISLNNTSVNCFFLIYNMQGQLVHQLIVSPAGAETININVAHLPAGIYLLQQLPLRKTIRFVKL